MKLGAYLRDKNIDIDIGFNEKTKTGKNEEFEVFEFGKKLFYALSKEEVYSSYDRYTNTIKKEKPKSIRKLIPSVDENLALMLDEILKHNELKRAVVFSEIISFISLNKS